MSSGDADLGKKQLDPNPTEFEGTNLSDQRGKQNVSAHVNQANADPKSSRQVQFSPHPSVAPILDGDGSPLTLAEPSPSHSENSQSSNDNAYDDAVGAAFDTLMQPVLESVGEEAPEIANSDDDARNNETEPFKAKDDPVAQLLTIPEVAGPLEEEAETAILEALEKRNQELQIKNERERRRRTTLNELNDLPEDAAHMFEKQVHEPTNQGNSDDSSKMRGESYDGSQSNRNDEMSNARQSVVGGELSQAGAEVVRPSAPADKQYKKGLSAGSFLSSLGPSQHRTSLGSVLPPPQIRNNEESEEPAATLKDMATQLRMNQKRNRVKSVYLSKKEPTVRTDTTQSNRTDTTASKILKKKKGQKVPKGDTDKLYHHASVLFGRDDVVDDSATEESDATMDATSGPTQRRARAAAQWRRVRIAVKATPRIPRVDKSEGGSIQEDDDGTNDVEEGNGENGWEGTGRSYSEMKSKGIRGRIRHRCRHWFKQLLDTCREVYLPRYRHMVAFVKGVVLTIFVPLLSLSAIFFYGLDNPYLGSSDASVSYWLNFVVRLVMTFTEAKLTEYFVIDMLSLRTKVMLRFFGPALTLFLVQSRGWPFTLTLWCVWNFAILYGTGKFANHWLFWQDAIDMFNDNNPSGTILSNEWYLNCMIAAIVAGVCIAIKRTWLAVYLGRRSIARYRARMLKLLRKMLLLSEVAHLAQEIRQAEEELLREHFLESLDVYHVHAFNYDRLHDNEDGESEYEDRSEVSEMSEKKTTVRSIGTHGNGKTGRQDSTNSDVEALFAVQQQMVGRMGAVETSAKASIHNANPLVGELDEWEEPTVRFSSDEDQPSIYDILQYKQALTYMREPYPFSLAFGSANTRLECVNSSQKVYHSLLRYTPNEESLPFDTIALVARDRMGNPNEQKLRELRHFFHPNRKGTLSELDFVRSCDNLYKKLQIFRAATANASQLDRVFEHIVNFFVYFVLAMVALGIVGIDPWALLVGLTSLLVSFAFAFGPAVSKALEGVLLIVVRKPYDIGDRISIANPEDDTNPTGSATWFVEEVTMFATTVRYASTNEVATLANGSLASSRIINAARSPNAMVYVYLKLASKVPYERVKILRSTVQSFVEARPQEWAKLSGFRATRVEANLGYIEYVVVLQHRQSWQAVVPILMSKAELSSFCLEVSKKLGMEYSAPPLPVRLGLQGNDDAGEQQGSTQSNQSPENTRESTKASTNLNNMQNIMELFKPENKKTK